MKADFPQEGSNCFSEDQRIELLSGYIDSQLLPSERRQVEYWLDTDREFKKKYLYLMHIASSIKAIPITTSSSPEDIASRLFERVDKQNQVKKTKISIVLSLLTIVSVCCLVPRYFVSQEAMKIEHGESLAIALNQPIIKIPQ